MLRKRMLIGLGDVSSRLGRLGLMAWRTWIAPAIPKQLWFSEASQTPETVAAINCGERFTILQYGFIFSRVQTKDGRSATFTRI